MSIPKYKYDLSLKRATHMIQVKSLVNSKDSNSFRVCTDKNVDIEQLHADLKTFCDSELSLILPENIIFDNPSDRKHSHAVVISDIISEKRIMRSFSITFFNFSSLDITQVLNQYLWQGKKHHKLFHDSVCEQQENNK